MEFGEHLEEGRKTTTGDLVVFKAGFLEEMDIPEALDEEADPLHVGICNRIVAELKATDSDAMLAVDILVIHSRFPIPIVERADGVTAKIEEV